MTDLLVELADECLRWRRHKSGYRSCETSVREIKEDLLR